MSNNISAPIEFQVLTSGQVRLYCTNRGRLFNFLKHQGLSESQGQYRHYNTGSAWIAELTPKQILNIFPYVSESNWKKAVQFTDNAIPMTTDKNLRPVSSKVFRQRMEKVVGELESSSQLSLV